MMNEQKASEVSRRIWEEQNRLKTKGERDEEARMREFWKKNLVGFGDDEE